MPNIPPDFLDKLLDTSKKTFEFIKNKKSLLFSQPEPLVKSFQIFTIFFFAMYLKIDNLTSFERIEEEFIKIEENEVRKLNFIFLNEMHVIT